MGQNGRFVSDSESAPAAGGTQLVNYLCDTCDDDAVSSACRHRYRPPPLPLNTHGICKTNSNKVHYACLYTVWWGVRILGGAPRRRVRPIITKAPDTELIRSHLRISGTHPDERAHRPHPHRDRMCRMRTREIYFIGRTHARVARVCARTAASQSNRSRCSSGAVLIKPPRHVSQLHDEFNQQILPRERVRARV